MSFDRAFGTVRKLRMRTRKSIRLIATAVLVAAMSFQVASQALDRTPPRLPAIKLTKQRGGSPEGINKLSVELRFLHEQFATNNYVRADGAGLTGFTSPQLEHIFGSAPRETDPLVTVSIRSDAPTTHEAIKRAGASIIFRTSNLIFAVVRVSGLAMLTGIRTVSAIEVVKSAQMPTPPVTDIAPTFAIPVRGGSTSTKPVLANEFNRQSLTGKNVIVGVIDSGIDWQHEDFIREDGTSRILAIWDLFDSSYETSNGAIGSKPPVYLESEKKWLGTLYTNAQINAALKGAETVMSTDKHGHGTAVAGTAVSNGRATADGVPAGTYMGVAPEADLVVVRAMDCTYFSPFAELTAGWIAEFASTLGRPVVINMSFGTHGSSHDGTSPGEQFIDSLVGPRKPGKVITVAAGNDGRYSLHASSRFGPRRPGQIDKVSQGIELFVKSPAAVHGVFNTDDDWCIGFKSTNPMFQGTDGKPVTIFVFKNSGNVDHKVSGTLNAPAMAQSFIDSLILQVAGQGQTTDILRLPLPSGDYMFWGYGVGPDVKDGRFDLYSAEFLSRAVFGLGAEKFGVVASPGNAKNAITVGSFDFRDSWLNVNGETTMYNMLLGNASSYTSAGFRRDGLVKPDIAAPARFTIASLAREAQPSLGGCDGSMASGDGTFFTQDGRHVAWQGTSAATPFVTGVIALMLQKNPTLDAEQVRQILRTTARSGGKVGAVPNQIWGWGMVNPQAALQAVPAVVKKK